MVMYVRLVVDPPLLLVNMASTLERFPALFNDEDFGMRERGWW